MQPQTIRVWQASALAAVAVVASAGCATNRSTTSVEEFRVTGLVLAGPTCPVERNPPDPNCVDRPVADAAIVITGADGHHVGEVRSNPTGRFEVRLPAGTYTLTPQPVDGLTGTPAPQVVTVGPTVKEVEFSYDTGIR